MEILYYTVTAVILYFVTDWLLERMERAHGRRFRFRSLVFFGIILILALITSKVVALLS